MAGKHYTSGQLATIRKLFRQGQSDEQIANALRKERHDITPKHVARVRVKHKIGRRRTTKNGKRSAIQGAVGPKVQSRATVTVVTDTLNATFAVDKDTAMAILGMLV